MRGGRSRSLPDVRVLWLVALIGGPHSAALGFPDHDARNERTIVSPRAAPATTRVRGEWHLGERGLTLTTPAPGGWTYWLPEPSEVDVADGLVRGRFYVGRVLDATLLFRASVPAEDPLALSGYGVSIERDGVALYRWDDGRAIDMGARAPLPGLVGKQRVEVVVTLIGPQLSASVYDAESLALLAHVSVHDARYVAGSVGVRVHARQDADTTLELLAVASAGQRGARGAARPTGPDRRVEVRLADRARLPRDLRSIGQLDRDRLVIVTDPVGLERIRRAGVEPASVSDRVPWRWVDPVMRRAAARGVVRTARGFVVDAGYKDDVMVAELLAAYAERFPHIVQRVRLGTSSEGRSLWALKISDHPTRDEDEPAVLLSAGQHGSELLAVEQALDAVQQLVEGYGHDATMTRLVDELAIWVVPLANPDGNARFTGQSRAVGRKNARDTDGDGQHELFEGVDLNRNYPFRWGALGEEGSRSWYLHSRYRGPHAASEPETRAMMELAEREHFVAAISFHSAATLVLAPYTVDGARNPEPDVAWSVAEELVAALPEQPNKRRYRVQRNIYAVDGTEQDWLFHEHGTLAYVVELPFHNVTASNLRRASVASTRPAWSTLFARVLDGPSVAGRVTDSAGRPLRAEVRVLELATREGERWLTRARDGYYDRVLPGPGRWRVQARASGYQPRTVDVDIATGDVTPGAVRVDIVLAVEHEAGDREEVH